MIEWMEPVIQIVLAALIGGMIGLERESSGKAAGLRTQLLVCVGSAIFTILSLSASFGHDFADPARISAQIVSGLGFLGGAVVLKTRGDVRGVTTAATIWTVASIGMAVGLREYAIAFVATGVVLITLAVLGRLEGFWSWSNRQYLATLNGEGGGFADDCEKALSQMGLETRLKKIVMADDGAVTVSLAVRTADLSLAQLQQRLVEIPGVARAEVSTAQTG